MIRVENINELTPEDVLFIDETTEPQLNEGQVQLNGGISFLIHSLWPEEATDAGVAESLTHGLSYLMLQWAGEHSPNTVVEFVEEFIKQMGEAEAPGLGETDGVAHDADVGGGNHEH